jgi:hypothetical protein
LGSYLRCHYNGIFYGGSAAQVAIPMGTALGFNIKITPLWDALLFAYPNVAGKMVMKLKFYTSNQ